MSAAGGNGVALAKVLNELMLHWDQTAPVWRDHARQSFENDYLKELVHGVRQASGALQQIEEILRQIRKECS